MSSFTKSQFDSFSLRAFIESLGNMEEWSRGGGTYFLVVMCVRICGCMFQEKFSTLKKWGDSCNFYTPPFSPNKKAHNALKGNITSKAALSIYNIPYR